jgi:hypothetical protein
MRTRQLGLAAIFLTLTAASPWAQAQKPPALPPAPAAAGAQNVAVTVTYTGKGPVDAGHGILVFLFSTPDIGAGSEPIASPLTIEKNGGTVTFKEVSASPVYIAVVYNESGNYNGIGGPPPVGTPVAIHSKDVKDPNSPPLAVTPGPKTTV